MGNLNPSRIILIGLFHIGIISPLSYANTEATTIYQSFDQSVTIYINNSAYINHVVFNNEQAFCSVNITVTRPQGHLFSQNSVNYSTFQWQLAQLNGAANISGALFYTHALGSSYITWDKPINGDNCKIEAQKKDKRIFPL